MLNFIKLSVLRTLVILLFCFTANNVYAFGTGKAGGTTTSGGTSSSSTGTSSACIGAPTGGKYGSASYSGSSGCITSTPGIDSDGDTMSDTWEDTYGLLKYDATDRYADPDADQCTNACEKARGTIPTAGTATACPGFSTTTATDADCDGVVDMDDPAPTNASVTKLTVNGTYIGEKLQSTDTAK